MVLPRPVRRGGRGSEIQFVTAEKGFSSNGKKWKQLLEEMAPKHGVGIRKSCTLLKCALDHVDTKRDGELFQLQSFLTFCCGFFFKRNMVKGNEQFSACNAHFM